MRIGLISDTYVPGQAMEVPPGVARAFEGVDLVLHAGNIFIPSVLDGLERIAPVKATGNRRGNRSENPNYFEMECIGDPRVDGIQLLELEGHSIGMVHDLELPGMSNDVMPGSIEKFLRPDQSLPLMVEKFFGRSLDIVVFGRTLYSMVEEHQGMLFVNPGSPSVPRNLRKLGSVAILELMPGRREARVIDLASVS
ncbi:MAG: YfcE family phosphodiesterase [Chloroflexi bacterium]|nr:YfcE family phosphodiesterase [Chloroflexota bacterium]